jgi:peptide/nickel transport system permease protein
MHSLKGYILRRVLISLLVIVLAAVFAFCIIRMVPGDPVRGMLGSDADESAVEAARKELNLDKPILTQLYLWFSDMLKGVNIPPCGYRESGKMETAVPAKWKPVLSPL